MTDADQVVDNHNDTNSLRWNDTFSTARRLEDMTLMEAYTLGFQEGYQYGSKQTVNLFAQHMDPHDVASIVGG